MNKPILIVPAAILCLTALTGGYAQAASTFSESPATFSAAYGYTWTDTAPYHRNILWDFSKNPTRVNNGANSGHPAYFGTADNPIGSNGYFSTDKVAFNSNVHYYNQSAVGLRGNLLKTARTGTAVFTIAPYNPAPQSNVGVYLEANIVKSIQSAAGQTAVGTIAWSLVNNGVTYTTYSPTTNALASDYTRAFWDVTNLVGNSTITATFNMSGYKNSTDYLTIDNLHMAITPEPAAVILYGIGGIPLAFALLRRRKGGVKV